MTVDELNVADPLMVPLSPILQYWCVWDETVAIAVLDLYLKSVFYFLVSLFFLLLCSCLSLGSR